ncbi:MAG: hypothetical protein Q9M92_17010 [Enterobacterales bacterium]|nr:hypothetical protein [Enterobacterales bacterium]
MKFILETSIYPLVLLSIAFIALSSGNLYHFLAFNILIPFFMILTSLFLFTFGIEKTHQLFKALLKTIITKQPDQHPIENCKMLSVVINYSYVSITLWVLYSLILSKDYSYSTAQAQVYFLPDSLSLYLCFHFGGTGFKAFEK